MIESVPNGRNELSSHLELKCGLVPRPKVNQIVAKSMVFTYQKNNFRDFFSKERVYRLESVLSVESLEKTV